MFKTELAVDGCAQSAYFRKQNNTWLQIYMSIEKVEIAAMHCRVKPAVPTMVALGFNHQISVQSDKAEIYSDSSS